MRKFSALVVGSGCATLPPATPMPFAPPAVVYQQPRAAAQPTSQWREQVQAQTTIRSGPHYNDFTARGYVLAQTVHTGLLDASTSERIDLNLPVGHNYILMGTCDYDCYDLEFQVLVDGIRVAPTGDGSDEEVAEFSLRSEELSYTLLVTMHGCSTPYCGYQITAWVRNDEAWQTILREPTTPQDNREHSMPDAIQQN